MRFFPLIITLILILTFSCKKDVKAELDSLKEQRKELDEKITTLQTEYDKKNPVKQKAIPVYVEPASYSLFKKYIQLQGKVDAKNNVLANSLMAGLVTKIVVANGQKVQQGQILAHLDDSVIMQSIRQAEQQIMFAKDLYERQQNLWSQEIGTKVQLISAKNNYDAAVKAKNSLLAQKNLHFIKSPINGTVDDVRVKIGEIVAPGSPRGIRVVNDSNLKIEVEIGEGNIAAVNKGDEVSVVFPDLKDSLKTRISYVSKTIDEIKRAFKAEINLPYNAKIKPNMLAEIKIASYVNPKVAVVNFGLIQNDAMGDYIMVIRQGKLTKARVVKGESYNGKSEILEGILLEDKIITAGYEGLQEGDGVKIVNNV